MIEYLKAQNRTNEVIVGGNFNADELHRFSKADFRWADNRNKKFQYRTVNNPRSVVCALSDNQISNYWTSAGPYDEIYYYIEKNVAEVRDDLALMTAGLAVPAKVQEYAATSMNLSTRDEIFSAMVVYGFLSYEAGNVCISNKELMDKFRDMLKKYGAAR